MGLVPALVSAETPVAVFVWAGAVETAVGTHPCGEGRVLYALSVRSLFFEENRDAKI